MQKKYWWAAQQAAEFNETDIGVYNLTAALFAFAPLMIATQRFALRRSNAFHSGAAVKQSHYVRRGAVVFMTSVEHFIC